MYLCCFFYRLRNAFNCLLEVIIDICNKKVAMAEFNTEGFMILLLCVLLSDDNDVILLFS